jgi:formate hydrogenlyase subunit 3/multisubunit Na+/H+ antiporter MnhD subunit
MFILIFPLIGSFIGYALGTRSEKYRDIFNIMMTGIIFLVVIFLYKYVAMQPIEISIPHIMGTGLHLKLDMFRYIFVSLTAFLWFLTTIYSTQYLISYKNRNRYYIFFMLTLASTIGIFISENFLNLFTFFEIMSFTSYALVIHDEDDYSHEAGNTYITMAVAGGLILLMGLFLLYNYTETLDISELPSIVSNMSNVKYVISAFIIVGFGVKAGMVPLHIWLPKAYPAAPTPATAVLSAVLAKTGIFGILITTEMILKDNYIISIVIIVIGFANMFIGGLLAIFQRNIKRILAYSSMSQIGYILLGIGLIGILKEHKAVAIYGTLYHVINHGIFKALLFMGAGTIYMALHELSINKIGGFGRNKNVLKIIFFIGLMSIIGMPGFNGFTGKTLLHEALSEAHHMYGGVFFTMGEIVFTISSSFTVVYLLKIFTAIFIDESSNNIEDVKARITKRALFPMLILGALSICIGIKPNVILHVIDGALEPFGNIHPIEEHFYSFGHIISSLKIILLGAAIYIGFVRRTLRKGSGKKWHYINPTLNWFSIEKHVYIPLYKIIFAVSTVILKTIDNALINSVIFISRGFESLCKMNIDVDKSMRHGIANNIALISNIKGVKDNRCIHDEESELTFNIKDKVGQIGHNMNSVNYSIFIFGIVLVVCLFILVY